MPCCTFSLILLILLAGTHAQEPCTFVVDGVTLTLPQALDQAAACSTPATLQLALVAHRVTETLLLGPQHRGLTMEPVPNANANRRRIHNNNDIPSVSGGIPLSGTWSDMPDSKGRWSLHVSPPVKVTYCVCLTRRDGNFVYFCSPFYNFSRTTAAPSVREIPTQATIISWTTLSRHRHHRTRWDSSIPQATLTRWLCCLLPHETSPSLSYTPRG